MTDSITITSKCQAIGRIYGDLDEQMGLSDLTCATVHLDRLAWAAIGLMDRSLFIVDTQEAAFMVKRDIADAINRTYSTLIGADIDD